MKWEKLGKIFDPTVYNDGKSREWMNAFAQCTSAIVKNDCVRVYFSCRPKNDEYGNAKSYTTYLELDKGNLFKIKYLHDKPVMPLGELGTFDEFAVYPTSIIEYENKYRLYYAGWTRMKSVPFNTSIGLAISNDGKSFKRIGMGPIISHTINEPFVISGPKVRIYNNKWYMFYLAGQKWLKTDNKPEIVYKIRMAYSDDGLNFTKLDKNIISSILEEDECQAGPDVFYYNGKYHMYFVYRKALNFRINSENGYRIGYATSDNLVDWTRKDEDVGITYSDEGWDSKMHHYPHIFELNNQHYMLYNGNEFGKYGFGIAKLIYNEN